ncbi:MAG TPA: monovalent cation/H(+) antiporter subunit G [Rhodoglobus sp.]|nr:monovalent cation/H(+) antiporter subunit G [Rhodoglobus sp.]
MNWDDMLDAAAGVLLVLGALLSVAAGVGLLRFPDALARLHAGTKPQIFGLICILAAIALSNRSWATLLALAPVLLLQMLTAPISAHMVGRAGYRTGNFRADQLVTDELDDVIDRASEVAVESDQDMTRQGDGK